MEIVRELREIPNLSLALGFFDGVHLGHQAVISSAVGATEYTKGQSGVVTFKEHPYSYFKGESPKYILSHPDKYKSFENLGVDYVIELDFAKICHMSPKDYLEQVLVKYFSPKVIATGFNHYFGTNKSGNVMFLSKCQDMYNYYYLVTPPETLYGDPICSSAIRRFIKSGMVDTVIPMLGKKFAVSGTVIKGRELGRTIGYPTANILFPDDIIVPPYGVYDVDVELEDGTILRGLTNFGVSPTVTENGSPVLETYILNFNGNLYGKDIKIYFTKMLRPEIKFNNVSELKTQIDFDIQSLL